MNCSTLRRRLVDLVVLKFDLIDVSRWRILPFESELWGACDELEARHVDGLLETIPLVSCFPRGPVVEVDPEAVLWPKQL